MPGPQNTARLARGAAILALLGASVLCAGIGHADEVYKSVDSEGHVIYSDRPFTHGAQKTEVTFQQADPDEAQRLAKEHQILKAEDDQRHKQDQASSQAKAQKDSERKAQCARARDRYNFLNGARRVSTQNPDGSRTYYSDEQADAMRAEAKRTMDSACGS